MTDLRFEHVSKWYGQVSALIDITLHAGPGALGLVGRNGAGKSTLMKLACGLLAPSEGSATVGGVAPSSVEARRLIGFCPDFDPLDGQSSALGFVTRMLRLCGFGSRRARDRAAEVLAGLGLSGDMNRPIREYSKGMRQRVRLAQALGHDPDVLLLDEPMNGLDPVARHEMQVLVRGLCERGKTVVVSSHVLHELEAMTERVALVHQGRLVAEGSVRDLRSQIDRKPHRILIATPDSRGLARRLSVLPQVAGMQFTAHGLEVHVGGQPGFYEELTAIGAEPEGLVLEVAPVDDSLASVFGYLVG
ncbi:MAG: ABC transporter ATP-binding protein [Planctomycetota bacterium]